MNVSVPAVATIVIIWSAVKTPRPVLVRRICSAGSTDTSRISGSGNVRERRALLSVVASLQNAREKIVSARMNKNMNSPSKLTEFAPLSPEESQPVVASLFSKFFNFTRSQYSEIQMLLYTQIQFIILMHVVVIIYCNSFCYYNDKLMIYNK